MTPYVKPLEFPSRDRLIARKLLFSGYESEEAAIIIAQSPDIQNYSDYKQRLALTKDIVNSAVGAVAAPPRQTDEKLDIAL